MSGRLVREGDCEEDMDVHVTPLSSLVVDDALMEHEEVVRTTFEEVPEEEEGIEYIVGDDGGVIPTVTMQVIDLADSNIIGQNVEVVTVESAGGNVMEQEEDNIILGSYPSVAASSSGMGFAFSSAHGHQSMNHRPTMTTTFARIPIHFASFNGGKTAPALLRNSRKFHPSPVPILPRPQYDEVEGIGQSLVPSQQQTASSSFKYKRASKGSSISPSKQFAPTSDAPVSTGLHQYAVILDEYGNPTNDIVVLAADETGEFNNIVERTTKDVVSLEVPGFGSSKPPTDAEALESDDDNSSENVVAVGLQQQQQHPTTIIICQDAEGRHQVLEVAQDANGGLVHIGNSGEFSSLELFDHNHALFLQHPVDIPFSEVVKPSSSTPVPKSRKKSKKPLQVLIGPDGQPIKKKGQTELPCMEKGCMATCYNAVELRRHLNTSHGLQLDEEVITFLNEDEFKSWRETYERERMVSFIFRGGTKKVAKDLAVAYLICHRSGHYKPTVDKPTDRKRKLKPQGSCKMGGYCTAGIKRTKNIETGTIKMEICHTHYGHAEDSDAIPHLRVTSSLRKTLLSKFKAGLSFTEVLAYIHHNPDRLEGLRLVDRRAVRNIYDTWRFPLRRSKIVQKDIDELEDEERRTLQRNIKVEPQCNGVPESADESPSSFASIAISATSSSSATQSSGRSKARIERQDVLPVLFPVDDDDDQLPCTIKNTRRSREKKSVIRDFPVESEGGYRLRPNRKVEVYKSNKQRKRGGALDALSEDDNGHITGKKPKTRRNKQESADFKNKASSMKSKPKPRKDDTTPPMIISEILEQSIDKLMIHGDSGPTVLLYKPLGGPTKYGGESRRDFRKDDFCVVLQTPVQRQLLQLFPSVLGFDLIENTTSLGKSRLKLAFLIIIDDYREPIPIAWIVANALDSRVLQCAFKAIKQECGELQIKFMVTPRFSSAFQAWSAIFPSKPKNISYDSDVRRDLKALIWKEFDTDKGRRDVWEYVESLLLEKQQENLDISNTEEKFEFLLEKYSNSGQFMEKFETEWLSRIEEWAMCYRYGIDTNLIGVSNTLIKLRKFIHFKGTRNLNETFEAILKIGYDKHFLHSKRKFKGDQKLSRHLDDIAENHAIGRKLKHASVMITSDGEDTWVVTMPDGLTFVVAYTNSPCPCKLICQRCNVCEHMYTCRCRAFLDHHVMCEHIHFVHCESRKQRGDPVEDESEVETIVGIENAVSEEDNEGTFGRCETAGTKDNPSQVINIEAVLKAAGIFNSKSDGLQPHQIVSITDVDTHTVIYDKGPTTTMPESEVVNIELLPVDDESLSQEATDNSEHIQMADS